MSLSNNEVTNNMGIYENIDNPNINNQNINLKNKDKKDLFKENWKKVSITFFKYIIYTLIIILVGTSLIFYRWSLTYQLADSKTYFDFIFGNIEENESKDSFYVEEPLKDIEFNINNIKKIKNSSLKLPDEINYDNNVFKNTFLDTQKQVYLILKECFKSIPFEEKCENGNCRLSPISSLLLLFGWMIFSFVLSILFIISFITPIYRFFINWPVKPMNEKLVGFEEIAKEKIRYTNQTRWWIIGYILLILTGILFIFALITAMYTCFIFSIKYIIYPLKNMSNLFKIINEYKNTVYLIFLIQSIFGINDISNIIKNQNIVNGIFIGFISIIIYILYSNKDNIMSKIK